ncbi:hypothetical protein ONS95_006240 [Cadophora gregata]|uniref:uncharacterized protein n=1 Tax=Cadophora gregata TaxID=51156 RepID=UPI0026DAC8DF|nr:uncharacterized protein ONS95_006240 [Cadophora gregata]KAK0102636.1 hypothetical protein ONS95_006240 [Cadophora gregata]
MESLDRVGDESVEDVFLQDDQLSSTIAEHARQCQSLFHKYMDMPDIVPDPSIIDDQLARFSLWAANMDVFGPLNVSLDYRLRYSPISADIIHQLLSIICDGLLSHQCLLLPPWVGMKIKVNGTLETVKPIDNRPQCSSRKKQRISVHVDAGAMRKADSDTDDSKSDVDPVERNVLNITETIDGTLTRLFRLHNAVRKSA